MKNNKSSMKKFLYFTAAWCGPCKVLKPKIQALAEELPIDILDVDANHEVAVTYGVRNIPTIIAIDADGVAVEKMVGNAITVEALREFYKETSL
jgi:thiol-disulfide isomerase/thioredoxin